MISVDEYIEQLEWLKEWMALKIKFRDGGFHLWWYTKVTPGYFQRIPNNFDQYCQYKQSL